MHLLLFNFALIYFLFTLSLLLCTGVAQSGFDAWPSDWVVVNNANLPSAGAYEVYKAMEGPFRVILTSSGKRVFSENGTFALGFIDLNSTGNFLLSVAMVVSFRTPPGAELWSANRNRPVKENATLRIGSSGNLVLLDWEGTEVWNSGEGIVHAIAMQESGDLELFNTTNASANPDPVWSSWVSPNQHTLVQGQLLPTGSKLVSNISVSNSSEGLYSLSMEPAGMILYIGTGSSKQPYWTQGFAGFDTYQSIQEPCFLNASSDDPTSYIVFTGGYLTLIYSGDPQNGTSLCPAINDSVLLALGSDTDSQYRFMRLDIDGNLRSYLMAPVPGQGSTNEWAVDFELFPKGSTEECRLPNVCGPYGICSNGQCSCPGSGSSDAFAQVDPLDSKAGCLTPRPLLCNENSSVDQHFLKLEGVDYFLNSFSTPEENVSTLEECKGLCSNNCSCDAFFFHTHSSSCFQIKGLNSLLVAPNNTFEAYLKVQNVPIVAPPGNIPSSSSSQSPSSRTLSNGSIAGIAVGAAAVLSVLFLFILRRRRAQGLDFMDPDDQEEAAFLEALPGLPPRFTLKELRVATREFKKKLGAGGFGSVYEGVLKDGSKVAVKRLNAARQGHKEFRAEVATIGSINHVNLVRLHGFCAEKGERLLIYELVPNGSLEKWIFKGKEEDEENQLHGLSWEMRLAIAIGTAKGLAYLHEDCRETILHLDIKPQNILVGDNFVPKVADFGMSRLMEGETAVRGTPGYLAPEWLRASIATKKCDVYSFGMVLLELIGGRKNFDPTLGSDPSFYYFPTWAKLRALEGKYMDLLDERIKGEVMSDEEQQEVIRMSKVAFCCIHENPLMRPTMGAVVNMLEGRDTNIPTLAALGLTNVGGEEGEFTQGASWALQFSGSCSTITNEQVSGPR